MRLWPHARAASLELSEPIAGSLADPSDQLSQNREAFRVFYDRTSRPLWAYLLRVSGRRDVADDLLQESFCRFLAAKLPEMDGAESKSYLFRIATNLLHDRWRGREVSTAQSSEGGLLSHEIGLETRADVRRAFEKLKPRERQLLWLAHVEGFDHSEIAKMTGLKAASIRVLLFRARRELARVLRQRSRPSQKTSKADLKAAGAHLDSGV